MSAAKQIIYLHIVTCTCGTVRIYEYIHIYAVVMVT